ncbi:MAG: group III truncated hemoglobin [Bacteroidetes bacterium]|nr:group III truncated hemoglobin [Bacteroidota bacterium]
MITHDIKSEEDIKTLVDKFYAKVMADATIGFIFTDVAAINLPTHMPVMYAFWSSVLLGTNNYSGNPMTKHILLNQKVKLEKEHFQKWIALWEETVTENFSGEIAELAITKARNIAGLMQYKIEQNN